MHPDAERAAQYYAGLHRFIGWRAHALLGYVWIAAVLLRRMLLGIIFTDTARCIVPLRTRPHPMLRTSRQSFLRRVYGTISDCWQRPMHDAPGPVIRVSARPDRNEVVHDGNSRLCINAGSYNYLGYGDASAAITVDSSVDTWGTVAALEGRIAAFVGRRHAVVFGTGFETNAIAISAVACEGDCILSDSANHASIVWGAKASRGVRTLVWRRGDMESLYARVQKADTRIRREIRQQERDARLYTVWVVTESVHSMDGDVCDLPALLKVREWYQEYCRERTALPYVQVRFYVDEAHGFGVLGEYGRGVCEHFSVDPHQVDVLMGTLSKTPAAVGGYVLCDDDRLVAKLRDTRRALYHTEMSARERGCILPESVCRSANAVLYDMHENLGAAPRIKRLRQNVQYMRQRLLDIGCLVPGDEASPVVPLIIGHPSKITSFSRQCLEYGVAVVVVGWPATGMLDGRARLCASASHTNEMLTYMMDRICAAAYKVDICFGCTRAVARNRIRDTLYRVSQQNGLPKSLEMGRSADQDRTSPRGAVCSNVCGGVCGPRGFYGTTPLHLELECSLRSLFQVEDAAVYSTSVCTLASIVDSIAREGRDTAVVRNGRIPLELHRSGVSYMCDDPTSNFSIVGTVRAYRRTILFDKVTDGHDAVCLMRSIHELAASSGGRERFCIIVDITEYLRHLCERDSVRILRMLGVTCDLIYARFDAFRGADDTDIMGSFCIGDARLVEYQRLGSLSYCFSAAMPQSCARQCLEAVSRFESKFCVQ